MTNSDKIINSTLDIKAVAGLKASVDKDLEVSDPTEQEAKATLEKDDEDTDKDKQDGQSTSV